MLANFALLLRRHRDNDNGPLGIVAILAVIMAPFAAMIVQMAISRTREYGADRAGAEICGNPRALASALAKIARPASAFTMTTPNAIRRRRTCSSSIR